MIGLYYLTTYNLLFVWKSFYQTQCMKLPVVLAESISSNLKVSKLSCKREQQPFSLFLLRMLLPSILSDHDNQASISDLGRHFVRHFALKRRFWNEMDFSRPVASTTNRRFLLRIDYANWPIVRKIRRSDENPTEWRFIWCKQACNFCYHIYG